MPSYSVDLECAIRPPEQQSTQFYETIPGIGRWSDCNVYADCNLSRQSTEGFYC